MVIIAKFYEFGSKTWNRFINGSYAHQLAKKIEYLTKEVKLWRKPYHNSASTNTKILK